MGTGARLFSARTPWDTDQTGPVAADGETGKSATGGFVQLCGSIPSCHMKKIR